jgi:4-amino-4-deoxy-L-arabinose transferase-like glycosyltransferase
LEMVGNTSRISRVLTSAWAGAQGRSTWYLLLPASIVLLGAVARFWNLNWDAGAYVLHPDEWALNQVVRRLGPDLNPHFFFYGSFPIYLYRATAQLLTWLTGVDWLDTSRVALVGRFYSALAGTLIIVMVFLVGRRLWSATAGVIAAALAASAPLLIQAAHFGTVDTSITLAGVTILWLSLKIYDGGGAGTFIACAVVLGLAIATKLTAVSFLIMPAIGYFLGHARPTSIGAATRTVAVFVASCALVTLVASPYYLLDWNELWSAIIEQSQELSGGYKLDYTWQFIGTTPYIFEGTNLALWSAGIATAVSALVGWIWLIWRMIRRAGPVGPMLILTLWPTLYFLYIGTWEARFARHTLPLVPFLSLFAGGVLAAILEAASSKPAALRVLSRAAVALVIIFSALWGLAFLSIYTATDTRLAATAWFRTSVPVGTHLVIENKDTLVPLPDAAHPLQNYQLGVIEPTTPDSPAKLASMASTLANGDLLVISSRRWSGTIPRLSSFPLTARYYKLLFAGQLGYTPVESFTDPPRLGLLAFPDDSAEETFQVFDHPTVRVYLNTGHLAATEITRLLEGSGASGK